MKPTTAKFDKEAVRWTLSWQPDGRCDRFTREAILACAPPTSGVYGLFNFDCQVFIGESANIQDALLHHESETDFQSRHLQPTGFTFEPCAVELRKPKAAELVARFRPVLQNEAALNETWSPSNGPKVSEVRLNGQELETYADPQEFPAHERETGPNIRRRFYFRRTRGTALSVMFAAGVVAIFYFGIPGGNNIHKRAIGANPPSGRIKIGLRPPNAPSIETAAGLANESAEATLAKLDVHASASTSGGAVRSAAKSHSREDGASVQKLSEPAKASPIADSAKGAERRKKWSVQISAVPEKPVADGLVQPLKIKGYDGYVVQAEVKGQTYYRVRVGHFDAREEAESVRQSLARQEGYRDAYLSND